MPLGLGTAQTQKFFTIDDNPLATKATGVVTLIDNPNECCFELPALAESIFTDDYKNDLHSFITFWNNGFVSATYVLEKYTLGSWQTAAALTDNTYGVFYDYGFYETIYGEKTMGYLLDWALVLTSLGEGNYRMKATGVTISGANVDRYDFDFCLREYTEARADRTVRTEWWLNGNIGNIDFDDKKQDYGVLNWYNGLRLPESKFGYDSSNTERKFVRYQSGEQKWLQNLTTPEYILKTGRFSSELHRYIQFNILMGDKIRVTDYNTNNPNIHQNRFIIPNGNYAPVWVDGSKYASVEVKFNPHYLNHEHKRC